MRPANRQGTVDGVPARGTVRDVQAARRTPLTAKEAERSAQKASRRHRGGAHRPGPGCGHQADRVHTLSGHAPIRLLGGFLTLLLLRNSGAAFSIGTSMTIVFTAIAVAVIFYILRAARKLRSVPWAITLGLLLGGATGNLADRIFARRDCSAAMWSTGSNCRTGPCSTSPTPPSCAAAYWPSCWPCAVCTSTAAGKARPGRTVPAGRCRAGQRGG